MPRLKYRFPPARVKGRQKNVKNVRKHKKRTKKIRAPIIKY